MRKTLIPLAAACLAGPAQAAEPPDIGFNHKDWELSCDNTRTCRAAGYHVEDKEDAAVSVLLTRKAGPGEPVTAQVQLGSYTEDVGANAAKAGVTTMKIDARALGTVRIDPRTMTATLSPQQTEALIEALTKTGTPRWSNRGGSWTLSGAGATAVLLKMDEFQGRVGTPGALVRKGTKPEDSVLPALPPTVIVAAPVQKGKAGLPRDAVKPLLAELRKGFEDGECEGLATHGKAELEVEKLAPGKLLVSTQCWTGAYNAGFAYWVINTQPPYAPELVTDQASGYANGTITAAQKGRGLGDCGSREQWTWDGSRFVQTLAETSGMCRLVAPGGPWNLPTLVTVVRKAK
ncbi:DUF1176 domain-containing protein [Pseudoduganella chitinolytica]|uniref:DUF1176 domain-containing protein n=1 Tax=Pseudoduganella chitinolytica TaxID=34070 RepID=A0ABY8B5P6_9BURK|nr:DUF1176 domain-containing protein [Pseudoduganella chitinolytica]WEF31120.1 DUF1176 domain-containing protein [Pseudoduganella chitinolytica]